MFFEEREMIQTLKVVHIFKVLIQITDFVDIRYSTFLYNFFCK
jgi:hypothetical protein